MASTFNIENVDDFRRLQTKIAAAQGMSNAIGYFHQKILSCIQGWEEHVGYDLECKKKMIIAEVKNKHNTMSEGKKRQVATELQTAIRHKKGNWVAYIVIIIPKHPLMYKTEVMPGVYETDVASFYDIANSEKNAVRQLFDALSSRLQPSAEILDYCLHLFDQSIPQST